MLVGERHYRTIWYDEDDKMVKIIDQRLLPFEFKIESIATMEEMYVAIKEMHLRGAGLIGAAAAWGLYLSVRQLPQWNKITSSAAYLASSRPTAINLQAALDLMSKGLKNVGSESRAEEAKYIAQQISDQDANACRQIGENGFPLIEAISKKKNGDTVNILTHCNAGWLAFVDYGSALSPIYEAFNRGLKVHVYVDETRPRNQGARLTAWELGQQGIPHTLIVDNAGGHLMQHQKVDMVIVGADRVSKNGDVANKIGTYLKALAANDNEVPFYVAFPSTTYDSSIENSLLEIPIEKRNADEVLFMQGWHQGKEVNFRIAPENTKALNYGFDITPARLVSAYITEKGVSDKPGAII